MTHHQVKNKNVHVHLQTHQKQYENVLINLQPHENLKKLMIENYYGTTFPNWLGDAIFSNMVSLRLSKCKYCESLPSLGQLSSLQELYIVEMERIQIYNCCILDFLGTVSLESSQISENFVIHKIAMLECVDT